MSSVYDEGVDWIALLVFMVGCQEPRTAFLFLPRVKSDSAWRNTVRWRGKEAHGPLNQLMDLPTFSCFAISDQHEFPSFREQRLANISSWTAAMLTHQCYSMSLLRALLSRDNTKSWMNTCHNTSGMWHLWQSKELSHAVLPDDNLRDYCYCH